MPLPHEMPRLSVFTDGTRTFQRPRESWNRYGFSRLTGVVSSVVYGGAGNAGASGAPSTPANTWFHTPLGQLATPLLRGSPCCCGPVVVAGRGGAAVKAPPAGCGAGRAEALQGQPAPE